MSFEEITAKRESRQERYFRSDGLDSLKKRGVLVQEIKFGLEFILPARMSQLETAKAVMAIRDSARGDYALGFAENEGLVRIYVNPPGWQDEE